jgi:altronate dehydratase
MNNEMNKAIVSLRFIAMVVMMLFVVQVTDCNAQRYATRKLEKQTFGQSRRNPGNAGGESKAAEKAMKEQARKEARREREDEKSLKELRSRHYEIQSEGTRTRMEGNSKATEEKYKVKRQKQKKEQAMPDLRKPERPGTMNARVKAATKDPAGKPAPKKVKAKGNTKDPSKQPELKQQKKKAKSKLVDPKKQRKLKQHRIKKY